MKNNGSDDDPFAADGGGINSPSGGAAGDETDRVDVHEYDDRLVVVADLPSVSEDSLELQCNGRILAVQAATETRPFLVRVDLPAYVDADSMERTLNNGILEVTLTRDRDPANIGFR
jgi:HSP20 family protein